MLVDSHCHLDHIDLKPFGGELGNVLETAAAHGVGHFLCVAVDLERWPAMIRRVDKYENVSVSVGAHPCDRGRPPALKELVQLAGHPKVVAIGETGLDYYYGGDQRQRQRDAFRIQIAAARETGKPLIVHSRDAKEDTLNLLADGGADAVGGVLHCFTGDRDMAARAMELNFYISFSGILTFKNAHELHGIAKWMPPERILVETDSPWLAPVPHRGKPNQPAWVSCVAEHLARLRGESFERVAATTTANYCRLFGPV